MEPFVRLMRTYCIDYTNSHDLSVCDSIMEPDYVVHIAGMSLTRDEQYKPAVEQVFERFPTLGLAVHELITNGDRLAMRFSEHAATPDGVLACWAGVGLYDWNGTRLTVCRVEQDFVAQGRQLDSGVPDALEPPHLDPWTTTKARPVDTDAEKVARTWLDVGELRAATSGRIDDSAFGDHSPVVDVESVDVDDLFSCGDRVAFRATLRGPYVGGLDGIEPSGQPIGVAVAGIVGVADGAVADVHAVTDRFGTWMALMAGAGS